MERTKRGTGPDALRLLSAGLLAVCLLTSATALRLLSAGLLAVCLLTSATVRAEERIKLTLLPVEAINLSPGEDAHYLGLLQGVLSRNPRLELRDVPGLEAALAAHGPACRGDVHCLRRATAGKPLDRLGALRVGRLSDTMVIRLAIFNIPRGVRQGTWQEVLNQPDDAAVTRAMERMVNGFAPPLQEASPWYTKWWVWTIAGAVVGGSVAAVVIATRGDTGPDPDHIIEVP
jgi:hypothetical protein